MLNRFPVWKYLMLLVVVSLGVIYSAPNLYAPDAAVQVSAQSVSLEMSEIQLLRAKRALDEAGIEHFGEEVNAKTVLLRLNSTGDQLPAKKVIQQALGYDYVVALSMASTTPEWLQSFGAEPMKLGLDLAGGVHFLLEVDTPSAVKKHQESFVAEIKKKLRKEKARYRKVQLNKDLMIIAEFKSAELRDKANSVLRNDDVFRDLDRITGEQLDGTYTLTASLSEQAIRTIEDNALSQNLTSLRNRVNELGVSEPIVQRQGRSRIVVELPGVQDTAEAKRIIGKTANLEFRLEAKPSALSSSKEEFEFRSEADAGRSAIIEKDFILTGENVQGAQSGFDSQTSQPEVNIRLDSTGGSKMHRATRNSVGRKMAVVFIEYKTRIETKTNAAGEEVNEVIQKVEKKIISLATIQSALGVQFRITGIDSPAEASELALLLRAGALAAPMYFVEERTIGPSLGAENIQLGVISVQIGLGIVLLFMLIYYRVFGLAANIALAANLVLLMACMSLFGATLTLPGIAGIVLTVGMAVDANVLIFSRIREELANGQPPQSAISAGFDRAFTTILDANLTTLIVAVVLYAIGSGPVKGFAVTLSIGILTSMFTAIVGTRALINLTYGGRNVKKVWI
jgi:preprotein translocase subunit SecD